MGKEMMHESKAGSVQPIVRREDGTIAVGCGMSGLLEMLTRPWTLHILWLLSRNGPMRFGVLRRSAEGISARLLTVRLRTLEERGFVSRHVQPTIPPEVTYSPTARLKDMEAFMQQLHLLSDKWQAEDVHKKAALLV
jgi:DNA-binding HxlR family transcriptional regulator